MTKTVQWLKMFEKELLVLGYKVERVVVATGRVTDRITFTLSGPSPFPEMRYPLSCSIDARCGYGTSWVRENLGVEPEVIHISPGPMPGKVLA